MNTAHRDSDCNSSSYGKDQSIKVTLRWRVKHTQQPETKRIRTNNPAAPAARLKVGPGVHEGREEAGDDRREDPGVVRGDVPSRVARCDAANSKVARWPAVKDVAIWPLHISRRCHVFRHLKQAPAERTKENSSSVSVRE